jgi:sporulation protein YlmC with PRC-barrel domain
MYALASKLNALPIISLQSGETVAFMGQPIIDRDNLEIMAYRCQVPGQRQDLILMSQDIRQMALDCAIVDAEDELAELNDVVRIKPFLEDDFSPRGTTVVTDLGRHLGRVEDYTINLDTSRVQKLYVRRLAPLWWFSSSLTIDRAQILDVTTKQIVVRDATVKAASLMPEPTPESNA